MHKARNIQITVKHAVDRLLAVCLQILILPFFAIIALAIWLDDGLPILFRQNRLGRQLAPFVIFKFRTMVRDADSMLDDAGHVDGQRITRTGRVLRFLSFDELPQLLNIIRGEMSFVGPRPTLMEHMDRYTHDQLKRFNMRPGITGLAQVNGRNTIKWSERIAYDIEYWENYSLWLDFKILLKTIKVWLFREGIVIDRNSDQVDDLAPVERKKR